MVAKRPLVWGDDTQSLREIRDDETLAGIPCGDQSHGELTADSRALPDQHPIDAITGLATALESPRTPTAHAASHAIGRADPLTPAAIGAATAAQGAKADSALQSIPDATSAVKGVSLLGASGGAARFGQKADADLGNVDNTADLAKPVSTATQTALNLKANLASPALTGTPTAPTAAQTVNNTQVATTAYVRSAITALPAAPVTSVAGRTGAVVLTKSDVGLGNVDNTADAAKVVASAAKLTTAKTIGGVAFDGSANISLPGVNAAGNQATTGNAATATKLATARTIGGVSFDGTANINLPGVNAVGNQNTTGSAATLTTARTIQTNLAAATAAGFNGSANVTPGVTGTLPLANGGTGATTTAAALTSLGAASSATTISTTAPLTGGGNLTANRTLALSPATAATATAAGSAGSVVYAPDNAAATVRNQAVTPAMLAAGALHPVNFVRKLTAHTTVHCAPASTGTGDGSSAANARELQAAINDLHTWNLNQYNVTFSLAAGTYTKNYLCYRGFMFRAGNIYFTGVNAGTVIFSPTTHGWTVGGEPFGTIAYATYFNNLTLNLASGYGFIAQQGASVYIGGAAGTVNVNMTGGTAIFNANVGSQIQVVGTSSSSLNLNINGTGGTATYFAQVNYFSIFNIDYVNLNITGTPAFTHILNRIGLCMVFWHASRVVVTGAVGTNTIKIRNTYQAGNLDGGTANIPGKRNAVSNLPAAVIDPSTTANRLLRTGTANTNPTWAQVGLPTDVTGLLPVANGGGVRAAGRLNYDGSTGAYFNVASYTQSSNVFTVTFATAISGGYVVLATGYHTGSTCVQVVVGTMTSTTVMFRTYANGSAAASNFHFVILGL